MPLYKRFFVNVLFCFIGATAIFSEAYGSPPDSTITVDSSAARIRPYRVNHLTVGAIIAVGLFTDAFAISRIKNKPDLDSNEINSLNRGIITSIDNVALNQNSAQYTQYSQISDYFQIPVFLLPGLLIIDKKIRKDWGDLLYMYVEGHVITFTFYNYSPLGPTFNNKYRPLTYYEELPMADRISGNNRNSFYSGHTASVTYTTFFMTKVYCDYHPEIGSSKYLWYAVASIPPLLESYFRIKSLAHFPSDCAVGYGLGAICGIVIPALHKRPCQNISLGLFTAPEATGLSIYWSIDSSKNPHQGY